MATGNSPLPVGHAAMIRAGEWGTASDDWAQDRNRGLQFKARFLRAYVPSSVEGIEKYLGSRVTRGIGPVYAKRMVKKSGKEVFDLFEAELERVPTFLICIKATSQVKAYSR